MQVSTASCFIFSFSFWAPSFCYFSPLIYDAFAQSDLTPLDKCNDALNSSELLSARFRGTFPVTIWSIVLSELNKCGFEADVNTFYSIRTDLAATQIYMSTSWSVGDLCQQRTGKLHKNFHMVTLIESLMIKVSFDSGLINNTSLDKILKIFLLRRAFM